MKKNTYHSVPAYTGRKPQPKIHFRMKVVVLIFLICILLGFVFHMLDANSIFFKP